MRHFKLIVTIISLSLFFIGCGTNQPQQTANVASTPDDIALADGTFDGNDYWAKDNLDLGRVGNLLERSNNPQEFESYLNSNDGINNLDLNGDGYVDYISVDEFQDRGDNERGLSFYTRYGPNDVQELGTIVFYRDDNRSPGARILVTGNEQLYGDNRYYETNWVDKTIGLVSSLFGDRGTYYHSPYYYNNYPDNYRTYQVVGTPVYRTRVERLYPQPMFVYTASPTFVTKIKIKSPNNGLHLGQIYAKLARPTKDQEIFIRNNPGRPKAIKFDKDNNGGRQDDKGMKNVNPHFDPPNDGPKNESRDAKPAKAEKPNGKSPKPDNKGQNKVKVNLNI